MMMFSPLTMLNHRQRSDDEGTLDHVAPVGSMLVVMNLATDDLFAMSAFLRSKWCTASNSSSV